MRKVFTGLLVALILMSVDVVWSQTIEAEAPSPQTTVGEAIIGFDRGFLPNLGVGGLLAGLPITGRSVNGSFLTVTVANLDIVRSAIAMIPGVKYVEDNGLMKALATPNDARYSSQYGPTMMGFPEAWGSIGYGSSSVTVALIDSGVRATHEDLAGPRLLPGHDYVDNDSVPDDTCGHGTHTAGIVGATANNTVGVAGMSQARILPMKGLAMSTGLFSSGCSGTYAAISQAMMDAADQGAQVVSMSIGGPASSTLQNAVDYAYNKGVILVAAAGNDGSVNSIDYPGAYPNVIAVGALDSNKAKASYSDMGSQLDVMAPGSSITSTYNGSDTSYASLSGTSMATPAVAGALALAMSCVPAGTTQSQIINALYSTADDLGAVGYDQSYGNGMARADKLVFALCPNAPAPANQNPVANFTATPTAANGVSVDGSTSTDPDGNPLTYAWNFGDSATATGVTASHTYAAAGAYNVTLTVNDGKGGTNSLTKSVTVSTVSADPDTGTQTVASGQKVGFSLSASLVDKYLKILVPSGTTQLKVVQTGPACGFSRCSLEADLYTNPGSKPTDTVWACRPLARGPAETCTTSAPAAGYWYMRAHRRSGSGKASLTATLS